VLRPALKGFDIIAMGVLSLKGIDILAMGEAHRLYGCILLAL